MRFIKVACAAVNQTPLDWIHNRDNLIAVIKQAQKQGVQILCTPELSITGYGCEDTFLSVNTCQIALEMLQEIVPHTKHILVAVGLPLLYRDGLYNVVAVIVDGKIQGFAAKQHLAGNGLHYEPRWFKSWPAGMYSELELNGQRYPLGDLIFELNGIRFGFEICEDAWAATRRGVNLALRGVDLILNPSASHFAFGKCNVRKRFVLEGARAFGVGYLYANLLGNEAGKIIYDGDTLIAAYDKFLAVGPRFSFKDYILTQTEIDIQTLRMQRASTLSYPKVSIDVQGIVYCPPLEKKQGKELVTLPSEINLDWEKSDFIKEEEFVRCTALGLFDYLRKSKAKGFVLNLSGGADSATCACLVYLMLNLSLAELGEANFRQKLASLSLPEDKTKWMETILFCLYQRSENSSEITFEAAKQLATALGAAFAELSVSHLIQAYTQLIEPIIGRSLVWEKDNIALQNIQARVRSPSAWLLANIKSAILLCPSNRSEAAVGYATMDGDTSGGLCPIAGVSKTFILHWLKWLETEGVMGIGALPVLKTITDQIPTAELQPKTYAQCDEKDLMPYRWLDKIEHLFVLEKRAPQEILKSLCKHYPEVDPKQFEHYIEFFLKHWVQSQWKRERMAPAFHLDTESLDPKTWCRYPILSGNYELELIKMRKFNV